MRQGQQNRRGRGRSRKPQNTLSRSFESNGPDVKIRGTAAHIAEKYGSLARDAQAAGDVVTAENYLQHAEHYNRIIMAAQTQASQNQPSEGANANGNDNASRRSRDDDDDSDNDTYSDNDSDDTNEQAAAESSGSSGGRRSDSSGGRNDDDGQQQPPKRKPRGRGNGRKSQPSMEAGGDGNDAEVSAASSDGQPSDGLVA